MGSFTVPAPLVTRSQGSAESHESLNQQVGEASNATCSVRVHHPTATTTAATTISSSASKRFLKKVTTSLLHQRVFTVEMLLP